MHFRDMRCRRASVAARWLPVLVAILIAAGCSTADEPTAAPSAPSPAVTQPAPVELTPSDPVPVRTLTSPPSPTPDPTLPPDPRVIPEDVEDIDVEYMQAVVDVFAHNEGEIVREAVRAGELTPRMVELMDRAYGDDLRDRNVLAWRDEFVSDPELQNFDAQPEDPAWTVEQVYTDVSSCVGVKVRTDRNPTASGDDLAWEELFLVLQPEKGSTLIIPWRLDDMLAYAGRADPGNPCG